ncbi:MAG TPA: hypothetical protein V6D19_08565 [Stenomitos sp.]
MEQTQTLEDVTVSTDKEALKQWICELTHFTPHQVEHLVEQHLTEQTD